MWLLIQIKSTYSKKDSVGLQIQKLILQCKDHKYVENRNDYGEQTHYKDLVWDV